MKVLFLGNEISSHTNFGGYVHVKDYPNADYLDIAKICPLFWKLGKPFKFLNYILAVRKACKQSKNYDVIHSIYEDNYYFPLFWKCKCKSVGTVHLDITGVYNPIRKFLLNLVLKKLDYIIVLSKEQEEKMSKLGYKCIFIPHGFIKPSFSSIKLIDKGIAFDDSKINIFFSGNTYRDLDTLEKTIEKMKENDNVVFHILSQKGENKARFIRYPNTIVYDRIDDDIYFTLLSKCDYNFLPLTFATANNTLLESQFLGVTSILPKLGGIMDYASTSNLFYQNFDELLELFLKLNKTTRQSQILKDAEKFNWNEVYKQLEKVYMSIQNEN